MNKIIDGRGLASEIKESVRKEIQEKNLTPSLAVILVGNDPASHLYVRMKETACHEVGIEFHKYVVQADDDQQKLLEVIDFLNADESITGILIQLPLPSHFDEDEAITRMNPKKDADGFHPENIKLLLSGNARLIPGLAHGVWKLLEKTGEELSDKKAIIIAKSHIFADPMQYLLKHKGIESSHILPTDPTLLTNIQGSDIVITAVGACDFIRGEMLKKEAIVIDVGINRDEENNLCGDVNFNEALEVVRYITPVPGGVGPVTVAMLLYNTLQLAQA